MSISIAQERNGRSLVKGEAGDGGGDEEEVREDG